MNDNNTVYDWNDTIENDGQDFVILDEGDYKFTITDFERGRYPGSAKIPPCNKATITVKVDSPKGMANVKTDLILFSSLEWKLSAFFRCIGMKKHGERLKMDWNNIIGKQGYAHFKPRTYTDNYGNEKTVNDLDHYIDYDASKFNANSDFEVIDDEDDLPFN